MWEGILVAALIIIAAVYTIYRTFFAPSCGCGTGDGKSCCSSASSCTKKATGPAATASPCATPCTPDTSVHCPCSKTLLTPPRQ